MNGSRIKQWMENESRFQRLLEAEHDSCGIVCVIEKSGAPARENLMQTIEALIKMEHRSGFIDGEGDGCGILTDLPRPLWQQQLQQAGLDGTLATDERFAVAHLFVPHGRELSAERMMNDIRKMFQQSEITIVFERIGEVNSDVLGPNARLDEPVFWQIALLVTGDADSDTARDSRLFEVQVAIEQRFSVHIASLSRYTAAYKLMGAASQLPLYFRDLANPLFTTQTTIGHNRYSTNTLSSFFRVQPSSIMGHNGEINTIRKLRNEAEMIGVPLMEDGSDSQDVNRTLETFILRHQISLFEAMEIVFPPIINEMKHYQTPLQDMYVYLRQIWGHFAQGPAAIVSRYADECVFSVDSLGLRPLWMVESQNALLFSSEQGIILTDEMVAEPRPLAPGEKVGVRIRSGQPIEVISYEQLQLEVCERVNQRVDVRGLHRQLHFESLEQTLPASESGDALIPTTAMYSAYGWDREAVQMIETTASTGSEPIRSLGHDGPLASFNPERQNIADYIKEAVAVVTNPAIDRDRETEHFSTRVIAGSRPTFYGASSVAGGIELFAPLLLEGANGEASLSQLQQPSLEQLIQHFAAHGPQSVRTLSLSFTRGTGLSQALEQLASEAISLVQGGARLLLLDDRDCFSEDRLPMDPHLAISRVDAALKAVRPHNGDNLRRHASLIVRSGAIRNLHDIMVACGLGADLVSPYLLFAIAAAKDGPEAAHRTFSALQKGIEKVISTIGTHELRGYTRSFSAIGLHPEVAAVLEIVNYFGSDQGGTNFADLEADAVARYEDFHNEKAKAGRNFHFFQRIWKSLNDAADGSAPYSQYADKLQEEERKNPVSLRHLLDFKRDENHNISPDEVDLRIGGHDLPMLISSMSFGSQNETAFRAYAEAGHRLNMATMNGEGGELKDMLGRYITTRGAQVASGRFGVNVELANSVAFLEIKIGQGAKPGEGGHLPGTKVTAKIAAARNATIGSDLISPSNNHDIYSIEDLAQIISELKEASGRKAKIIVKVPVVPNIGTIAVGIAKGGADIITLSGFDGGTGAARIHSLQHVGLPTEIGTKLAHLALIEAGLRDKVELWSDGGMKSGADVVKMVLLGANRCGFGSISMQAIGCTTCRGCHLDTCHVGIATQIDSREEADEKGLRRFIPRVYEPAVESLVRLFTGMGEEIRTITASLGARRLQDLVGRADLLTQFSAIGRIDLTDLLQAAPFPYVEPAASGNISAADILTLAEQEEERALFPQEIDFDQARSLTFSHIDATRRIAGTRFSSHRVRNRIAGGAYRKLPDVSLQFVDGSIPGNGLAAFNADGINIRVQGGSEDSVAKMAFGGRVSIVKSMSANGQFINGSVGKSFAYGAQQGRFYVQGHADSRACIRLSGADVVFGGEITTVRRDEHGNLATQATLKGFAFEYMTNGRAVVLGDPGPWICAGMTGGVIYQRVQPALGLDEQAIRRRIAKGAKVDLTALSDDDRLALQDLLVPYREELLASGQQSQADSIASLLSGPDQHFIVIRPVTLQADQAVATE